ncbi:MAG: low temperature requirement protein A [Propioniciclava sp.]
MTPPASLAHRLRPLGGRDPEEPHRAATPLELLYDLTLVVAFGVAGSSLAHAIAADHIWPGIAAFAFTMFGAVWAWLNYTWFASAYDTDDWFVRLAVLVQMVGVLILALGIPEVFDGFEHGWELTNGVLVAGYVVMRVPLIALWLRVVRDDPAGRDAALKRIGIITAAQIGWTTLVLADLPGRWAVVALLALYAAEFAAPVIGNRGGTMPWHPHHLAERFGLLTIIALGEGIIGTFATIQALIAAQGWSVEAVSVLFSGVALTFGLWWFSFVTPIGEALAARRRRMPLFSFGHIGVYLAIAAIGAGLHVAAYTVEGSSEIGTVGTMWSVVIPVAVFTAIIYAAWPVLMEMRTTDPLHLVLIGITVVVLGTSVALASAGVSIAWCLAVAALSPWVTVVGFELLGHRHLADQLRDLRANHRP